MYRAVLQKSVTVSGVRRGLHISRVTSDRVWISDDNGNLILTNTKGEEINRVTVIHVGSGVLGVHTVDSYGDLIYIDRNYNINKLSTDNNEKTTIIKYNTAPWIPRSVYSSPSTGDLLVGMYRDGIVTYTGKVVRYNSTGEYIQTIQHNNITGQGLYIIPEYITENRNGDVIVSDWRLAVVVTDGDGNYRFSYTGPPSGSGLSPFGICTDALSHILVCDYYTQSVQMLDSEGHYLTEIDTPQHGIDRPCGLSYDEDTHLLWVGARNNNTVNLYRVVDTDSLTGVPLEKIKCRKHPRIPLDKFCTPCGVPLCVECTSSEDHSRHQLTDIETLFDNIHRIDDGDTLLMCLLISNSYKINMKEGTWMTKYNDVANIFHSKEVTKPFAPTDLEKYKPILKLNESEISFSTELFKYISFLKFSKRFGLNFTDIFLTWADKENIAEYCRSWNYQRGEDEVCCWLLPEKNEEFLKRLGQDIFMHSTMVDQSFHEAVFKKFGVPIQIIMRGDKSVKKFIENLKKGKTMMYHASGMIIGCAGSGKTTLLQRLKGIDLNEIKENTNSTRGVDIHTDVFEVTDSLHVNFSSQQKHFKLRLDKKDLKQSVSEHKSENAADYGITQEKMERVDEEGNTIEASNRGQISHENTNVSMTQTASSNEQRGVTLSNAAEVVKESTYIPHSSEISGNLQIGAEDISDDPEKKITMTDFAGQCSYYASHQIFLSPRAFFILVLNMEKKFDDKVGEEVCCQEGSIYGGWTNRDYLEFWMKSVHQYSSDKAPVILVGTHSEEKTEKEKTLFFREVWKTLEMHKSLKEHLNVKRRFAIGFNDDEGIENIKLSILDVVGKLDHWGEELPRSWAMFETFFQEKKKLKILKMDALIAFNEALPEGIKLQTRDDINVMLQFFHDIREILYFAQVYLKEVIILDVQWFADAFKNVITDKNHAEEDLLEFTAEWDKFNKTGELPDTLLCAIWEMNNNGYIEHKKEIMLYMEKLGLLAKMSDNKWYVPCMNKIPFPLKYSSSHASSILCYMFDVLPAGIFHRLVATCMQIPWKIVTERNRPCIYQTAAIFTVHDHNVFLGMTPNEIQLQVFVIEGEVELSTCHKVREKIDSLLSVLSTTFQTDFKFMFGFKCKSVGFCDNQESSVIDEAEFSQPSFQCPSCPIERKHIIKTNDITKYWIEPTGKAPNTAVASGQDLEGRSRFAKLGMTTNDILNQAYRDILETEVPPSDIENKVNSLSNKERKNLKLNPDQEDLLKKAKNSGYKEFDISLTYKMIRNICSTIPKPTKGKWGEEPTAGEVSVGDDIERIRFIRNRLAAHVSSASTPQKEFDDTWSMMSDICQRLETFTGKKYFDHLKNIQKLNIKEEDEDAILKVREIWERIKSDMQELETIFKPHKPATN